jgi:hypothetical protein
MIKTFFSHVCNDDGSHAFLDWISEKVRKDLKQFDPFVACRSKDWNDARDLNDHLDEATSSFLSLPMSFQADQTANPN